MHKVAAKIRAATRKGTARLILEIRPAGLAMATVEGCCVKLNPGLHSKAIAGKRAEKAAAIENFREAGQFTFLRSRCNLLILIAQARFCRKHVAIELPLYFSL